jgi:hypothetical protein
MTGSRISVLRRTAAVAAVAGTVLALTTSTAASASGDGGHHSHARTEHFVVLQTDPNASQPTVVARGPIHARGTDTVVDDNHDVFTFPKGSINVVHHATKSSDSFDPTTCYGHFTERGKYRITGGTGAYDDARGHGTYRVEVNAVGCDQNAPPEIFSLVIRASGPLHL